MENPISKMLNDLCLTTRAFCVFNNLSINTLSAVQSGKLNRVPQKVKSALQDAGCNVSELDHKYHDFLVAKAHEDVKRLKETSSFVNFLEGPQ